MLVNSSIMHTLWISLFLLTLVIFSINSDSTHAIARRQQGVGLLADFLNLIQRKKPKDYGEVQGAAYTWKPQVLHHQHHHKHCWRADVARFSSAMKTNCAIKFIKFYNSRATKKSAFLERKLFEYLTDMTAAKNRFVEKAEIHFEKWDVRMKRFARKFRFVYISPFYRRQLKFILRTSSSNNARIRKRLVQLSSQMKSIYSTATACFNSKKCLSPGEQDVKNFFANSSSYEDRKKIWLSWATATGPRLRGDHIIRTYLLNLGARENGYNNYAEVEVDDDFEDRQFSKLLLDLYNQFQPLYVQLHAYIRHKLSLTFSGKFVDPKSGLIPGHLGDDPWSASFTHWYSVLAPFPSNHSIDFDAIIQKRAATGKLHLTDFPHIAENFFLSIGLPQMTKKFWKYSVFQKPKHKSMDCHGSAFDLMAPGDFRIKMCAHMNLASLKTVHHEMGHTEYHMLYRPQPFVFRNGANTAFHEAVGDTIALSFKTVKHFHKIGFTKDGTESHESTLNTLMQAALENVVFLPFALNVDLWRWGTMTGEIKSANFNKAWWDLQAKYSGIGPPVDRDETAADALSKYHVATNVGYIRYFISFLLKFDFYRTLCHASGHKGSLSNCDFYGSKVAGAKLKKMLSLGCSQPWPQTLQEFSGYSKLSADAMMEYFQPLLKWLKDYNTKNKVQVGWKMPTNTMKSSSL